MAEKLIEKKKKIKGENPYRFYQSAFINFQRVPAENILWRNVEGREREEEKEEEEEKNRKRRESLWTILLLGGGDQVGGRAKGDENCISWVRSRDTKQRIAVK